MDENSLKKDPDLYSHFYKRYWDDIQDQSDQTEDLKREEFAKISRRYLEACNQFKIHHPKASRAEMKKRIRSYALARSERKERFPQTMRFI